MTGRKSDQQHANADLPEGEHIPVLLAQSIDALNVRKDGVYVDVTFGRGGHTRAILERLGPHGRVLALDRDPQAIAHARDIDDPRLRVVHARFSTLGQVLDEQGIERVDGVLMDLGVSSPQLDQAARGFSFQQDGPLDMRMDPTVGVPVAQWLNEAPEEKIREIIKNYGEERFAGPIAKAIVACRKDAPGVAIQTTKQLADVVASVVRRRSKRPPVGKNEATRTFQALRIFINQEFEELALVLKVATQRLRTGGRLVVISFHSLEDRIVKDFIATESGQHAERDPVYGTPLAGHPVRLRRVGRHVAAHDAGRSNRRERSAVLRVAERVAGQAADPAAAGAN